MPATNNLQLSIEVQAGQGNQAVKTFNQGLNSVEATAQKVSARASASFDGIGRSAISASNIIKAALGVSLFEIGKNTISIAADFQRARIGLEAFVGSAQKANDLFDSIQDFALKSPFQFKDLLAESNKLLAYQFQAAEIIPMLQAISAAGSALNFDRSKFDDLVTALGQVKAAGRLTGEELRQLRNAGVPAIDYLSKAFNLSTQEMDKAIRDGIVPADAAVRILLDGMMKQFGKFNNAISQTATVAFSNFLDALSKLADKVASDYLPVITEAINNFVPKLTEFSEWIGNNKGTLESLADRFLEVGAAIAAYNLPFLIDALTASFVALGVGIASNPLGLVALGLTVVGIEALKTQRRLREMADEMDKASDSKFIRNFIAGGKTVKDLKEIGYTTNEIKKAMQGASIAEKATFDTSFIHLQTEVEKKKEIEKLGINKIKQIERIRDAEGKAQDKLDEAQKREFTGLAKIIDEYSIYRREMGLSAKANQLLAQAVDLRLKTESQKELKKNAEDYIKDLENRFDKQRDFDSKRLQDSQKYEEETLQMRLDTLDKQASSALDFANFERNERIRILEGLDAQTVAQKIYVEQERLKVEIDFQQKSSLLHIEEINRRKDREVAYLDLLRSIQPERYTELTDRIVSIHQSAAEDIAKVDRDTNDAIIAARQTTANKSNQIIKDNAREVFDQIKESSGKVFDDMLTKGQNIFQAIGSALKNAIMTVLREIISSQVALMLTRLLTGQNVGLTGSSGTGGRLGGILGALGVGSKLAFGGGFGNLANVVGGPGGTGGFAGPVRLPDGTILGGAGAGSAGGGLSGSVGGIGGAFGGLFAKGGLAAAWPLLAAVGGIGLAQLGFKGTSSGNNNLIRGLGAAGTFAGATIAGGAIGTMIMPGLGTLIGLGIGAAVGTFAAIFGLVRKTASDKVREKVRSVYGVEIREKNILNQVVEIAKQTFGGNIDVAVRSPQVRELIELYAMSTGQNISGLPNVARPSAFAQTGGNLYSVPTYVNGGALPSANTGPITSGPGNVTVVLDPDATRDFWETQTLQVVGNNPRAIQDASIASSRSNYGRKESVALAISPGLVLR